MSSAGPASAEVIPLEAVEDEHGASEPTLEVTLDQVGVYFPEEPVVVNGKEHGLKVNHERLAELVNKSHAHNPKMDRLSIHEVRVQMGDSLPASLSPEEEQTPVYDPKTESLRIVIPPEVARSMSNDKELVALIEESITGQIRRGVLEVWGIKRKTQQGINVFLGSLILAPEVGTATGLALEGTVKSIGDRGLLGGLAGFAFAAAGLTKGVHGVKSVEERGIRWGQNKASKSDYWLAPKKDFRKPIITLKAKRQPRTTQS